MRLLLHLVINTLIILFVAAIVPGIYVQSVWTALIVAIVLAIINVTLKPVLILLTLPINILTLGLFTFVINGLLLWLVATIVKGFEVQGFLPALIGALIISLFRLVIHRLERVR